MTLLLDGFSPLPAGTLCCPQRDAAGACFSHDRKERFALWRRWSDGDLLGFLLLNPSIADEQILDPTLKRCAGFAQRAGYGGMEITNLFPLVSTDPNGLATFDHSAGKPRNLAHIRDLAERTRLVLGFGDVCAAGWLRSLALPVLRDLATVLDGLTVYALATTDNGLPRHPLARGRAHIPSTARPEPYDVSALLQRVAAA
jgi:hypothetical protein